ncbi:MAG: sigma-54-dependent Fis family transcriptional regulator [Myxococcales bacterium]|nr:sigma-54-dependent Fis family transcriptional regulator [Myxococcales bacterium]
MLRAETLEAEARVVNISECGLGLILPGGAARVSLPSLVGRPVEVRLRPDKEDLEFSAELRWADESARDITGEPATAAGLLVQKGGPSALRWLSDSIRTFRHLVLVVDDEETVVKALRRLLEPTFRVRATVSPLEALSVLEKEEVAVLVTDLRMPQLSGQELLEKVRQSRPASHLQCILVTAHRDTPEFRGFVESGQLFSSIGKPFMADEVRNAVGRAAAAYDSAREMERLNMELARANERLLAENRHLRRRLDGFRRPKGLVGGSPAMRVCLSGVEQLAQSEIPLLIQGETGSGKELIAHLVHEVSPRAGGPFVPVNCGGVPEQLAQSFLFGHRKGAFTGAGKDARGAFREADGGALFLDEVGDASPSFQASLLRALERGEVVPVGETRAVHVDVRIICATHRNLEAHVKAGNFREDLYFRLAGAGVEVPPLRERPSDIALLARHFLELECAETGKEVRALAPEVVQAFEGYGWPGNVRELELEVKRLVAIAEKGGAIGKGLLSPKISQSPGEHSSAEPSPGRGAAHDGARPFDEEVEELERELVSRALEASGGVLSRAASILNVERTRLSRLVRRLGLPHPGAE